MTLAMVKQILGMGSNIWAVGADSLLAHCKMAIFANVVVHFFQVCSLEITKTALHEAFYVATGAGAAWLGTKLVLEWDWACFLVRFWILLAAFG